MTPDIQPLDEKTIERIAAGEVIERPASVVKELVENSVDAGAARVDVTVEAGGTERIAVRDDGEGMTREETRLAVREHTTSKIRDIDDLESGVATLGFRGEALHAIGAVSRLRVTTRKRGEHRGTELRVEGGAVTHVGPAGCPEGTTVEVTDLFYNVPARRKYLKQVSTEFSRVNGIVTGYALANPDVAVSLSHGDRETFATPGQDDLRAAVMAVYGRAVAANMIPLADEAVGDGPLDGISGLVSHPETNRAGREYMNTFVDGRYVTAAAVREAVVDAYGTQLAPDRYPFAVLFLDPPPGTVDVNVHPRKLEVRFADEEGMRRQVGAAVEDALLSEGLLRSSAPRGRSQAEQTEIEPGGETTADDDEGEATVEREGEAESSRGRSRGPPETSRTPESAESADSSPVSRDVDEPRSSRNEGVEEPEGGGGETAVGRRSSRIEGRKFRAVPSQRTLDGSDHGDHEFGTLPSMRVLGQLHDTYVVAETADGLVLVDQHAADERVNYERLRERFAGDVATQALAEPAELELTAGEAELLRERGDALAQLGFRATLTDDRTARVTTVPALLADAGAELARDLLAEFVSGDTADTVEAAADELLGDLACYPSVTGNESLTEGSVTELLTALDDCENPYACPHGRPVVIEFGRGDIEDRFERDYPGHGGRRPEE